MAQEVRAVSEENVSGKKDAVPEILSHSTPDEESTIGTAGDIIPPCPVEEGSSTPVGNVGRIKAPASAAPSLKREALSSSELSRMCFSQSEAEKSSSVAGFPPPSSGLCVASNGGSISKIDSVSGVAGRVEGGAARELTTRDENSSDGPSTPSATVAQNSSSSLNAKVIKRTTSRQGRMNQRWVNDPRGLVRLVTGCVPIMNDGRILFVSASRKNEWILPKGGWEMDEEMEESAVRETYEEAGILGSLGPKLSEVEYETRKARKRRLEREDMLKKKERGETGAVISSGGSDVVPTSEDEQKLALKENVTCPLPKWTDRSKPVDDSANVSTKEDSAVKAVPLSGQVDAGLDETASVASAASGASDAPSSYALVRLTMFTLYVSQVEEKWPESGRARKVVDIDEAIAMLESRKEFRDVLMEVKEKGLHLVADHRNSLVKRHAA